MLILWILVFIASLALLVKSADWLIASAEKIGLALKISPFIVGVTIVALGTSFPELAAAIVAIIRGANEIIVANAIGSNIANILLVIGISAIAARTLVVRRSLIDLDAPLLVAATAVFVFVAMDGLITMGEGIILMLAFMVYFLYTLFQRRDEVITPEIKEVMPGGKNLPIVPSRVERRRKSQGGVHKINYRTYLWLVVGIIGLIIGANYVIESIIQISGILGISTSLIVITAMAIGTSLPELVVSVRAAFKKKYEVALGNVFGSNVFNILVVTGIPSLITPLVVDNIALAIGLPFLVTATVIFVISGISRRIHLWEGSMYLIIYLLFLVKLFSAI
jgi:cation:H+ antiporter